MRHCPIPVSSNQYTDAPVSARGLSKRYDTHSVEPRWSHHVIRRMSWSFDDFGSLPSFSAVTVSFCQQCDAFTRTPLDSTPASGGRSATSFFSASQTAIGPGSRLSQTQYGTAWNFTGAVIGPSLPSRPTASASPRTTTTPPSSFGSNVAVNAAPGDSTKLRPWPSLSTPSRQYTSGPRISATRPASAFTFGSA